LRSLFAKPSFDVDDKVFRKVRGVGDVRLILVGGIFLNYAKSKADMILVANNVSRSKLKSAIATLEAEIGQEVRFVLMTVEELQYRLNMMDRFLIEFIEQPYQEILNKLSEFKRFVAGVRK
jgi:ubiquinone/menaquinone biosynthesis C-methylase UbiE